MKTATIAEVVETLVGRNLPVGDSAVDEEREENLKQKIDLVNVLLNDIYQSAEYRHSQEFSVRQNGERAYSALLEWKERIEEVEEELA